MNHRKKSQIGNAGEALFDKWARTADFLSTQPIPDIIGVDRFFEIPTGLAKGVGLDETSGLVSGWVQIKTTTVRKKSVSVKLDICRRFVFVDTPVFFFLIFIDAAENPTDLYILHVDEEFGAKVLKELRELGTVAEAIPVHSQGVTIRWSGAHRISPSAPAVRARLAELIKDPESYATRKKSWRDEIGFEPRPIKLGIRVGLETMARHLLGEGDAMEADITRASRSRFGIAREIAGLIGASRRVSFGAAEGEAATLRVVNGSISVDVSGKYWTALRVVDCEALADDIDRWRYSGGLLNLRGQKSNATITARFDEDYSATLDTWSQSAKACRLLGEGKSKLTLLLGGSAIPLGFAEADWDQDQLPGLELVETATQFGAEVGLPLSLKLSGQDLTVGHEERANSVMMSNAPTLVVELDFERRVELPDLPVVVTKAYSAFLGSTFAVCVVTTESASWSRYESEETRSRFKVIGALSIPPRWILVDSASRAEKTVAKLLLEAERAFCSDTLFHLVV